MTPIRFAEANKWFGPPPSLEESQCKVIHAYVGTVDRGSVEGLDMIITAWQPSEADLARLNAGGAVYLTCLNILPGHMLTTSFEEASKPA